MLSFSISTLGRPATPSSVAVLELREYEIAKAIQLTIEQRDRLIDLVKDITITPTRGTRDQFDVKPGATIGTCQLPGLQVIIRPKLAITRVLFMLTYTLDKWKLQPEEVSYGYADDMVEAMALAYAMALKRSLAGGLLQGYETREEALQGVRGRLRFDEQLRRHFGRFPPVECRFDEYTEDILENRLLKAALNALGRMPIRSLRTRTALREWLPVMEPVSNVEFHPTQVPEVLYTRLNDRYRPALELARLILQGASFRLSEGRVNAATMLFDMNVVFEGFVVRALRDALGLSEREFPQNCKGKNLWLDEGRTQRLEPDFSWWQEGRCVLVGDVKYKDLEKGVQALDLYQALAYCVAADLPAAIFVHAAGPERERVVLVRHAQKRVLLIALRLDVGFQCLLEQLRDVSKTCARLHTNQTQSVAKTEPRY